MRASRRSTKASALPLLADGYAVGTTLKASPLRGKYEHAIDRESAYELLRDRAARSTEDAVATSSSRGARTRDDDAPAPRPRSSSGGSSQRQSVGEAVLKSVLRSAGTQLGREGTKVGAKLVRGILGSLFGGK